MANFLTRALASVGMWAQDGETPDPMDPRWWNGGYAHIDVAGQNVTAESALQIDVVSAVLERMGGALSSLPMMVFERTGEKTRRPAPEHPLYKILHAQPNKRLTSAMFRDEQARHLSSWRNCYSLIKEDPETGHPVGSLEMIHPRRVQRVAMGDDGHVYYTVTRLSGSGVPDVYRDDVIWHIRRAPLTEDGLCGRPIWDTNRKTLAYAQAVHEFGSLYFKNGGSGGGVIKHPGNFKTPADREQFLETWRTGGTGLNRHKDRILLFGAEYSPFSVDNDEAQFNESKSSAGKAVCRILGCPPHVAGILDNATFSNIEQQSIEGVVYFFGPMITAIEQAASQDLLVGPDQDKYFVEINVAGLLRGDIKTRYAAYAQARQWGWLSVNDIRAMENANPIEEGGDEYLRPLNMTPVGQPTGDAVLIGKGDPSVNPTDEDDTPGNGK